jgi:hypothetical protein
MEREAADGPSVRRYRFRSSHIRIVSARLRRMQVVSGK